MELLQRLTGISMVHAPYKVAPQVLTDLVGGQLQATVEFAAPTLPFAKAGTLRVLAIVGARRKPVLPDVPTAAEQGYPEFDVQSWNGYVVPAGTPPEIIARLHREIAAALKSPEITDFFTSLGAAVMALPPDEFAAFVRQDVARWARLVKETGVHID